MSHPLDRHTVGAVGALGALLVVVWAVGFLLLGLHARGWHVLLPAGAVLIIAQGVRRLNAPDDDDG